MSRPSPDFDSPRAWAIDAAFCVAAGVALGVLGPFGSYFNAGFAGRLLQWTLSSLAIAIVYGVALRAARPVARRYGLPAWAWIPAVILVAAVPLAVGSRFIVVAVWPFLSKIGWLDWYGQTVLTSLPLTCAYVFARVRLADTRPASPLAPAAGIEAPDHTSSPSFLSRLPPRLGRDLVCLVMEDHYVRAHTLIGSDLVLLPLRKAIEELSDVEGMQVHRSWWVARAAVEGIVEDGRNLRLRLSNGLEAPVSRASVARLRAAGWL